MIDKGVIITGATGMVGGCALRICLENPDVSMVTAMGRSQTEINHTKLREVVVEDFTDYSALEDTLENQDVAIYCLGAYTGSVPNDLFREITVDYSVAFAKALHKASPQAAICFLSGQGADRPDAAAWRLRVTKGRPRVLCWKWVFPGCTSSDPVTSTPSYRARSPTSYTPSPGYYTPWCA